MEERRGTGVSPVSRSRAYGEWSTGERDRRDAYPTEKTRVKSDVTSKSVAELIRVDLKPTSCHSSVVYITQLLRLRNDTGSQLCS